MLQRTDAITYEVLEPITFVLVYRIVYRYRIYIYVLQSTLQNVLQRKPIILNRVFKYKSNIYVIW